MANGNSLTMTAWGASERDGISALLVAVDDRELHRMADPLKACQWTLRFARSGSEARAVLNAEDIPLVIVDGDAESSFWRDLLEPSPLPKDAGKPKFVVASREADVRLWAEVLNLGGFDLLIKPLDADEVAWLAKSALADRNDPSAPAPPPPEECTAWNGS